jgi:flagellar basal body rod protein FlgB
VDVIGRTTQASKLKVALDQNAQRVRSIADRVARAGAEQFSLPKPGEPSPAEGIDLETEMTRLADAQLRYDASAKLLQKTYETLRLSMRDR